ncbi:MAG TPA: RAMP superfamily CRISPR-associated protein [bacterium]|nr:RAMP superfamily CRISPR-associated protein [bacterium]
MKLKIKTLSYTLVGSGEASVLIDSDIIFDDFGIPFIPAKRIKGLLKESATEIIEILGISNSNYLESIFGTGSNEGKTKFSNLFIKDYKNITELIKEARKDKNSRFVLSKENIIKYFTETRQQTAINEKGVAKPHSLRTYRVLKPFIEFEGTISDKDITDDEKSLLFLAVINLKRIGVRRNRGLGKIKCEIEGISIVDIDKEIKNLTSIPSQQNNTKEVSNELYSCQGKTGEIKKLPFTIKTLSPIIITKQTGDQNTVSTEEYIPGTLIRGILANKFIKKFNLGNDAHKDKVFRELFLDGKLTITPAYPSKEEKEFYPAPLSIHIKKAETLPTELPSENNIYNLFEEEPGEKTRPLGGFVDYNGNNIVKCAINKRFYFHNTRENRTAGHSVEGGIFYYESIDEGQEFKGYLIGDVSYLSFIKNCFEENKDCFGEKFTENIGRSKTAQYGEIEFSFGEPEEIEKINLTDTEFTLTAISPIILYNEYGFPEVSIERLKKYLEQYFSGGEIEIEEKAFANIDFSEGFMGIWKCKTQREISFKEGTSFKIKLKNSPELKKLSELERDGIGEKRELGFGRVKINWLTDKSQYKGVKYEEQLKKTGNTSATFNKILTSILMDILIENIKHEAIKEANTYQKKITNSLIGRIEKIVMDAKEIKDIEDKLKEMKDKPAGKELQKIKIWDNLKNIDIIEPIIQNFRTPYSSFIKGFPFDLNNNEKFELFKIYWLTFFRMARYLNKKGK